MKTEFQAGKLLIRLAALIFGAVFCLSSAGAVHARPQDLDRQLLERSWQYLRTLEIRTVDFPGESRRRIETQARAVVLTGQAKLRRATEEHRLREFESVDFEAILANFSNESSESNPALVRAIAFLNHRFRQPTPLELALSVALPPRFDRASSSGILARHRPQDEGPFLGAGFGLSPAAALSTSPGRSSDSDVFRKILAFDLTAAGPDAARFLGGEVLPAAYPLIARTIVLRI